jgi:hypothetical protein
MQIRSLLLIVVFLTVASSSIFAQHSLQIDNGSGSYSTIFGSAPGGIYILPGGGGNILTDYSAPGSPSLAWLTAGNSNTTPGTHFLGTTDNIALHINVRNGVTINNSLIFETNGSISREVTGVTAGNARGSFAVDMQQWRTAATQVASGDVTVIAGGFQNIASGYGSVVSGGQGNNSTFNFSTISGGQFNTASDWHTVVSGGGSNTASADYSTVSGGHYAHASKYGQNAHAAGRFAAQGDAQTSVYVMRQETTNNTATSMFLDGSAARLTIPNNSAYSVRIQIVAINTTTPTRSATFRCDGVLLNNGGTTSGSFSAIASNTTGGFLSTVAVSADDINDALDIQVTGGIGQTIRWVARVETAEVSF